MALFQIHNAFVEWDPVPSQLRAIATRKPLSGGFVIVLLFVASCRSSSIARLVESGDLDDICAMPWAQTTVDSLRYALLKLKDTVCMAEGIRYAARRPSKCNRTSFGAHSDWIREVIDHYPSYTELLSNLWDSMNYFKTIDGNGAFRALHLVYWLFLSPVSYTHLTLPTKA